MSRFFQKNGWLAKSTVNDGENTKKSRGETNAEDSKTRIEFEA